MQWRKQGNSKSQNNTTIFLKENLVTEYWFIRNILSLKTHCPEVLSFDLYFTFLTALHLCSPKIQSPQHCSDIFPVKITSSLIVAQNL